MIGIKQKIKQITSLLFGVFILLVLIFGEKLINIPTSIATDNTEPKVEASLDKYVNYNLSEQDKGTLIQYGIRVGIDYEDEQAYFPVNKSQLEIDFEKIDNKYPFAVKLIYKDTKATNGNSGEGKTIYAYDSNIGKLLITTSNQDDTGNNLYTQGQKNEKDEYTVACYYDTYTTEKPQRIAKFDINTKYRLSQENGIEVNKIGKFSKDISEDISNLTSVDYQTEDIYDGYIKSNAINGTEYVTDYKECEKITITKKEAQDNLELTDKSEFIQIGYNEQGEEIEQELGNNGNLVYKSTKVTKKNIIDILGEDGFLQISDVQGNLLAEINKNTIYAEDGTFTIKYLTEPNSIVIKTSKIFNEGVLQLEHIKEIKPTMNVYENVKIKTTNQLVGIRKSKIVENGQEVIKDGIAFTQNNEKKDEIKNAQTSVNIDLDKDEWTNEKPNEVTFDIKLNSNSIKYNLFKNPTIKMELPEEVEEVILGESEILNDNGLELQDVELSKGENGNSLIYIKFMGNQREYNLSEQGQETSVKVKAKIMLKKDIEKAKKNIQIVYTNDYPINMSTQVYNLSKEIKIINYKETSTFFSSLEELTSQIVNTKVQSNNQIKLEVIPTKGEDILNNEDIIYEGEYIKYNIKVTNISNQDIENIKVQSTIPEGVTYGELETDYFKILGEYEYNFDSTVRNKEYNIEKIEAGKSYQTFYEVKADNLENDQIEKEIQTLFKVYVGENEILNQEQTNKIKKANAQVTLKSAMQNIKDGWYYEVTVNGTENVDLELKVPNEFEFEYIAGPITTGSEYKWEQDKYNINENIISTTVTPGKYIVGGVIKSSKFKEYETEDCIVELKAYATAKTNGINYSSNENRIKIKYESISVTMESSNENEELKYKDEIDYKIIIRNNGGINFPNSFRVNYLNVKDYFPSNFILEEVTYEDWEAEEEENENHDLTGVYNKVTKEENNLYYVDEKGENRPRIDINLTIPYGESAIITIKGKANLVFEKTEIENSAIVSNQVEMEEVIQAKTTNKIKHYIMPYERDYEPGEEEQQEEEQQPSKEEQQDEEEYKHNTENKENKDNTKDLDTKDNTIENSHSTIEDLHKLKIEKYINKVTVNTKSGTKTKEYKNEKMVKCEIKAKEIDGATVFVTYNLVVKNDTNHAISIGRIIDNIPNGFELDKQSSRNWMSNKNNEIYSIGLENTKLNSGESIETQVVLKKQMSANATGTFTNIAKIENGNVQSKADIIISVSTGSTIIYISITIAVLITLGVGIYLVRRFGFSSIRKTKFFFVIIAVLGLGVIAFENSSIAWTIGEKREWMFVGVPGDLKFIDRYNNVAHCCQEGCEALGDYQYVEYEMVKFDREFFKNENVIDNPDIKFTLTNTNNVGNAKTSGDYCIFGPFSFLSEEKNTAISSKYDIEIKDINGKKISEFVICNNTGNNANIYQKYNNNKKAYEGNFYVKIPKNKCNNGISAVKLIASKEGLKKIEKEKHGYAVFHNDQYQDCITDDSSYIEKISETEEVKNLKEISWSVNSCLEIVKSDAETNSKLKNVEIKVTCGSPQFDKTYKTDSNGKIVIDDLPSGKYLLQEVLNPNYGYSEKVSATVNLDKGVFLSYNLKNTRQTGSLIINKKDKDTGENISEVQFRLKQDNNYIRLNNSNSLSGTQMINSHTTTTNPSQATTLVPKDGQIKLINLATGTYQLEEISVGKKYGYKVDGDYIYINESNTAVGNASGKHKTINVIVTRQSVNNTNNIETTAVNSINVYNRKKYIKVSGNVWEDIKPVGKGTDYNNKFGNEDVKIQNIKVTLKNSNGTNVTKIENESTFTNPTYTDANGYYAFEDVLINNLSGYYLEFEYDGEVYTTAKSFKELGEEQTNADTSKAQEVDSQRGALDSKYNNVVGTTSESKSRVNNSFDVNYTLTRNENTDATAKTKNVARFEGQLSGQTRNVNKFNEYENYDSVNKITATTKEIGYGVLGGETVDSIRSSGRTELSGRNCGLVQREQVDLSTSIDLENVIASVNGYTNTYKYGKSNTFKGTVEDKYGNTVSGPEDEYRLDVKGKKWGYYRKMYASDIVYNGTNSCEVYLTYSITVRNNSNTLSAKVTNLANYHDSRYTIVKTGLTEEMTDSIEATWTGKADLGNGYTVEYTSAIPEIPAVASRKIYVQYKLNTSAVVSILSGDITLNDVVEINGYTTYYGAKTYYHTGEGTRSGIYASIDRNSAPKNITIGNATTYENDTMSAPAVIMQLKTNERIIEGNVFEDMPNFEGEPDENVVYSGQERIGNGLYNKEADGDRDVGNVTVELFEYNGSEQPNETTDDKAIWTESVGSLSSMWVSNLPKDRIIDKQVSDGIDQRYNTSYETEDTKAKREGTYTEENQYGQLQNKVGYKIPAKVKTDNSGHYEIYGVIPGRYILKFTYGNGNVIYKENGTEEALNKADYYKSTIITSATIRAELEKNPKVPSMWYKTTEEEGRTSDAADDFEAYNSSNSSDESIRERKINHSNQYDGIINTKSAYTAPMNIKFENMNTEVNSDENGTTTEEQVDADGETVLKINPDGTQQVETVLRYDTKNVDFGIIEKAKQWYQIQKEITNIKITLANGQVLIDGNPSQNLQYVKYLEHSPFRRSKMIDIEIDNELLVGATLEISYKVKAINDSESNYLTYGYYYFGEFDEESDKEHIEKLTPSKVIDYLNNDLVLDVASIKNSTENEILVGKIKTINGEDKIIVADNENKEIVIGKASDYLEDDVIKSAKGYENILILQSKKSLGPKEEEQWNYTTSRVLTTSDKLEFSNYAENIEVISSSAPSVINRLGSLNPQSSIDTLNQSKETDFYGGQLIITSPTGENRNYSIYIIGTVALTVVSLGIIIIKRKVF